MISLIFKIMRKRLEKSGYKIIKPSMIQPMKDYWMRLLQYFKRILDIDADVKGDIVECGVGKGNKFLCLAFLAILENKKRKIWDFDSFKGFPEPTIEDKSPRYPQ